MTHLLLPIAYLCAIGFSLYTSGWLVWRADRSRVTGALAACQLLIIIWCIPQLFLSFPMTREMKYVLYCISYTGISFIGAAWLVFSFLYCGRRLRSWLLILLFGISALDYSMLLTNELHHLFYRQFEVGQVVYGPVFYFHMVYTYLCVLAGALAVGREFRQKRVAAAHMAVILLAAAVPLGFNLLYILGLVRSGFDLTPPAFSISSFLMLLAVFRYDFLNVNVLTFEHIFESIAEGVIIYNKKGTVTYCNDAAGDWLGIRKGDGYSELRRRLQEAGARMEEEGTIEPAGQVLTLPNGGRLRLRQYIYHDKKGAVTAGAVLLTDVGEYYELLRQGKELAVAEQRFAIEQERNRIAQEVHDTTGHTLTMIQSLVKLIRITKEEDIKAGYLDQAQKLATDGIRELRWAIRHMRQGTACELVTEGVYQLIGSVREITVEAEIQGKDSPAYSHLSKIVYECLREAITNCLKYANASRMDVIVKFAETELCLYIFDDGQGCASICGNNGIRGIRDRVEKAGGQVRFLSAEGEGFQIYVKLPVEDKV